MNELARSDTDNLEDIQLLTFTLADIRLGVDTTQIDEMLDPGQAEERQLDCIYLHEVIPFSRKTVSYTSPKVLLIKDNETPVGFVIEEPDTILSVTVDIIQPLPALFVMSGSCKAIWGAIVNGEKIVLLVDLYKMIEGRKLKSHYVCQVETK